MNKSIKRRCNQKNVLLEKFVNLKLQQSIILDIKKYIH